MRFALCPSVSLVELMRRTASGQFALKDPPRRRRLQRDEAHVLLKPWVLG
jgi:hypothetical protein